MPRRHADTKEALSIKKLLDSDVPITLEALPHGMQEQAKPGSESIYKTALREATPDQVARANELTGMDDPYTLIFLYEQTENPV